MKLLIAEDDRDIALFYKVVLEARNHHVVSSDLLQVITDNSNNKRSTL